MSLELEVPGLYFTPEIITEYEEEKILNYLENDKGRPIMQIHPAHEYGWKFLNRENGYNGVLTVNDYLGGIPEWLKSIWYNCIDRSDFPMKTNIVPDHVLINRYEIGDGCRAHVDDINFWTDWVVGLSLGSGCTIVFSYSQRKIPIYVPARSVYVLTGEARYNYTHEINQQTEDLVGTKMIKRNKRTSITFREISEKFLSKDVRRKTT